MQHVSIVLRAFLGRKFDPASNLELMRLQRKLVFLHAPLSCEIPADFLIQNKYLDEGFGNFDWSASECRDAVKDYFDVLNWHTADDGKWSFEFYTLNDCAGVINRWNFKGGAEPFHLLSFEKKKVFRMPNARSEAEGEVQRIEKDTESFRMFD